MQNMHDWHLECNGTTVVVSFLLASPLIAHPGCRHLQNSLTHRGRSRCASIILELHTLIPTGVFEPHQ